MTTLFPLPRPGIEANVWFKKINLDRTIKWIQVAK